MWQVVGIEKMTYILHTTLDSGKIELRGSALNLKDIDIFSDVDMRVFLHEISTEDYSVIISTLSSEICDVFGYEIHNNDHQDVLRVCLENGWRFDITFEYHERKHCLENNNLNDVYDKIVNEFWFKSVMVLMKIGRNDFLVAAHLALELCQLNIVMQMIERDNKKNTNIHRFGDKEAVSMPSFVGNSTTVSLNNQTANDILRIVFQASERMDEIATKLLSGYFNKSNLLKNICHVYLDSYL